MKRGLLKISTHSKCTAKVIANKTGKHEENGECRCARSNHIDSKKIDQTL